MRRLGLLTVIALVSLRPAHAQTAELDEDLFIEQAALSATHATSEHDAVLFIQGIMQDGALNRLLLPVLVGDGNLALTIQQGSDNAAALAQQGATNLAVLLQRGDLNTTTLDQFGNRNLFAVWLEGTSNRLSVTQEGDDNTYVLGFVGDNLDHTVYQSGNDIHAVQIGVGRRPFGIEQRGEGMNIQIEHLGH